MTWAGAGINEFEILRNRVPKTPQPGWIWSDLMAGTSVDPAPSGWHGEGTAAITDLKQSIGPET